MVCVSCENDADHTLRVLRAVLTLVYTRGAKDLSYRLSGHMTDHHDHDHGMSINIFAEKLFAFPIEK